MSSGLYTFRSRPSKVTIPAAASNTTSTPIQKTKSKSKSKSTSTSAAKPKPKSKSLPTKSNKNSISNKSSQQSKATNPVTSELSENAHDSELEDDNFTKASSESSSEVEPSEEEDYDDTPVTKKSKKKVGSGSKRGPYRKRLSVDIVEQSPLYNAPQAVKELMPSPNYSLLVEVKTPTLEYILKHLHAVLQEARVEATRDESKQFRSQQAVEQLIATLDTGFEAAFCLTMNRYSAFCTVVDIPAFPITYPKVALHFARVLPTPLGAEFRRLIPQSQLHGLPISPLSGGPPLSAGEGSRVGRELVRNWGEALAYCQLNTTTIWEDKFDPSSGIALFGPRITKSIMSESAILEILAVLEVADREYAKDYGLNASSTSTASTSKSIKSPLVQSKVTSKGKRVQQEAGEREDFDSNEPDRKKTKWNRGGQEVDAPVASPISEVSGSLSFDEVKDTRTSRANSRSSSSSLRGIPIPLAGDVAPLLQVPPTLNPKAPAPIISRSPSPVMIPSIPKTIHRNVSPESDHQKSEVPIDSPIATKPPIDTSSNFVVPPPRPIVPAPPIEPWQRFVPSTPQTFGRTFNQSSVSHPALTSTNTTKELDSGYVSRITPSPDQARFNHVWGSQPQLSYHRNYSSSSLPRSSSAQSSIHPHYQPPSSSYALNAIVAVASQAAHIEKAASITESSIGLNFEEERWESDGSQGKLSRFDESSTRGNEETPETSMVQTESVSDQSNQSDPVLDQAYLEQHRPPHLSVDTSLRRSPNVSTTSKSPLTSTTVNDQSYSSSIPYLNAPNYVNRYTSPVFNATQSHLQNPSLHRPQQNSPLSRPQFTGSDAAISQMRQQSLNLSLPNNNGSLGGYGAPFYSSPNNPTYSHLSQAYYSPQVPFNNSSYGPHQSFQPYSNYIQPPNMLGSSNHYNSVPSSYSPASVPYDYNLGNRATPLNTYQQQFSIPPSPSQQQDMRRMNYPSPSSFNSNPQASGSMTNYSTIPNDNMHSNALNTVDHYGRSSGTRNSNLPGSDGSYSNFGNRNDYGMRGGMSAEEDVEVVAELNSESADAS